MSVSIQQIAQTIEQIAPKSWAEDWDNVGLLVGDGADKVDKVLITLDGTGKAVEEAKSIGAQLIIAHHPILFKPLKNLRADNSNALVPIELLKSGINYYAAHTNLDQSVLSSSRMLAKALGLKKIDYLTSTAEPLVKLAVFVPPGDAEKVRQALAEVGVGAGITDGEHSDSYSDCFFQAAGTGMFRALDGANPAVGYVGQLNRVEEVKLESVLPKAILDRAVRALKRAHPYEEPAFDLIPLLNDGKRRGYGAVGYLERPVTLKEFWNNFKAILTEKKGELFPRTDYSFSSMRLAGDWEQEIRKVGIVNGSGGTFLSKALYQGIDLLITGDVDHHTVLDALEGKMAVCDMGHYLSEVPMLKGLYDYLISQPDLKDVEFVLSSSDQVPWLG